MDATTRNIKLVLAYDGTSYAGWQRQKKEETIQGILEERIAVMTGDSPALHGAGRTDAGVHSLGMVANFHTISSIPCSGFLKGLNSMLPDDIRVLSVSEESAEFHARYSATGKKYVYVFSFQEVILPTERLYCAHFRGPLDISAMRECLDAIIGEQDFSSFEASGSREYKDSGRGAVREIFSACLDRAEEGSERFVFEITGDGFLRHMVRNIVGTLIEVGQGRRTVDEFRNVIKACDRSAAGPTAPARGLFLKEVFYD